MPVDQETVAKRQKDAQGQQYPIIAFDRPLLHTHLNFA